MESFIGKAMGLAVASPDSVAGKVALVVRSKSPPLRVYGTPDAFLFSMLRRTLPRRLYNWVSYRSLPKIDQWGCD